MNWLGLLLISIIGYGTSNTLVRYYSTKITPLMGAILLSSGALATALIVLFFQTSTGEKIPTLGRDTLFTGLLSGVFFTGAVLLFNTTLSRNVPLSIAVPILVGGIGVAGVIAGVAVFHESMSLMKLIGISVILVGTVILAKG
ncbi:MAG: EamA family transporter [Patescibacteria group bacterium]